MMRLHHLVLSSAVLVLATSACSISYSSESIGKSISSPFKSSSDSGSDAAYQGDVREYTATYVRSGGDFQGFERKIGTVAAQHGITDWELDKDTYLAIGQGLRKGGLKPIELAAWKSNLAHDDTARADEIQQGYDGALE